MFEDELFVDVGGDEYSDLDDEEVDVDGFIFVVLEGRFERIVRVDLWWVR